MGMEMGSTDSASCHNETVKDNGGQRKYKVYVFRAGLGDLTPTSP